MLSWPPATTIVALAGADLLGRQRDRAQAGAADLVDAEGGVAVGDAGGAGGLAGGVLALGRGQHLAEDHLVDVGRVELGALHRGLDRLAAEHVGGKACRSAPLKLPTGVRTAETMTTSSIFAPWRLRLCK